MHRISYGIIIVILSCVHQENIGAHRIARPSSKMASSNRKELDEKRDLLIRRCESSRCHVGVSLQSMMVLC